MHPLSYIDKHCEPTSCPSETLWAALLQVLRHKMSGSAKFAQILGCEPAKGTPEFVGHLGDSVPGFRVSEVEPHRKLVLQGRHRFSDYDLTFTLEPGLLCAETRANFPGVLGQLYKTAVIRSGVHGVITKKLLREIVLTAKNS